MIVLFYFFVGANFYLLKAPGTEKIKKCLKRPWEFAAVVLSTIHSFKNVFLK